MMGKIIITNVHQHKQDDFASEKKWIMNCKEMISKENSYIEISCRPQVGSQNQRRRNRPREDRWCFLESYLGPKKHLGCLADQVLSDLLLLILINSLSIYAT